MRARRLACGGRAVAVCVALLAAAGNAVVLAQKPARVPDVAYVYPAGGQQGTTFTATVGGQNLAGVTGADLSGEGIHARFTGYSRPLPAKRFQEFNETLQERRKQLAKEDKAALARLGNNQQAIGAVLQEAGATDEEIRLFFITRQQRNDPKRQDNKQLVETVTLEISIDDAAPHGPRQLRLFGKNGISNPLAFLAGEFPESRQPEATEPRPESPTAIRLPATLNGQILPGQADRYRFAAVKGERLVFVMRARDLVPYLADAVPGWFQPVLTVFDANGAVVAEAQCFRFRPDPVLLWEVPASGDYELEVRDSIFRGREDFVYRVTAGRLPFVTGVFPLGGRAGTDLDVGVYGWNLEKPTRTVSLPQGEGILPVPELGNGFATTDNALAHDLLPEIFAVEPDDTIPHAQLARPPVNINGRIESPGDIDLFAVPCRKGHPLVFEIFARRLNSPIDAFLRVSDPSGSDLACVDDLEDPESTLLTHHADPCLVFDPPADGLVYVTVGDAQNQGGADFSYRLRIREPRPDFSLRISPSGISGAPGESVRLTVHALRKEGFEGDILLSVSPPDFVLSGDCIPAGTDSIDITITLPDAPSPSPLPLTVTGTANPDGHPLSRTATPSDDMLQAFFYSHLVPSNHLVAYINPDQPPKSLPPIHPARLCLAPSEPASLSVRLPERLRKRDVRATLEKPPDGIKITKITPGDDGTMEIVFVADAAAAKPGMRGNLFVALSAQAGNPDKQEKRRHLLGLLPAIPFEVAAPPVLSDAAGIPHANP
jgi:hypothetical protein